MTRMHLTAQVPNDGAHRLAWFIGTSGDPSAMIERVAAETRSGVAMIDRLLCGEVEPEGGFAMALARVTDGAVLAIDWLMPATRGWFDPPEARPVPRAA